MAIREQQNKGYLPDGTARLSRDGEPIRHFMGTSTFAEYTVMPEIALAKVSPEAPLDRACLFACGLSTGLGAAMYTAQVERRVDVRRVRRRAWSASARSSAAACRAPSGSSASTCPTTAWRWPATTARPTPGPAAPTSSQRVLEETGGFGADYTFEATGLVQVMQQAVESARMGWGLATIAGVAGKGETLDVIPRWLITGPPHRRVVVRRRQGPRPGARSWSTATWPATSTSTRSSPTGSRSTRSTGAST